MEIRNYWPAHGRWNDPDNELGCKSDDIDTHLICDNSKLISVFVSLSTSSRRKEVPKAKTSRRRRTSPRVRWEVTNFSNLNNFLIIIARWWLLRQTGPLAKDSARVAVTKKSMLCWEADNKSARI